MLSARRGTWAGGLVLADHVLISAATFITTVLAARAMSPAAFGVFVLAYVGLQSANAMTFSLITQPHNVLGATADEDTYLRLTGTTLPLQLGVTAVLAGLTAGAAALAGVLSAGHAATLAALSCALIPWQMQDYLRRILMTRSRYAAVLIGDGVTYLPRIAVFWLLLGADDLTLSTALLATTATAATGLMVGAWQTRRWLSFSMDHRALGEMLGLGRWFAGSQVLYLLANHGYILLTSVLVGATAAGSLRAALTIVGPLNVVFMAFDSVLPGTYARALHDRGEAGLRHRMRQTLQVTLPPVFLYCAGCALIAGPLLGALFGDSYEGARWALVILCAQAVASYLARIQMGELRARRLSRPVFTGHVWSVGASLPVGAALTYAWGIEGAAVGMLLGALILLGSFFRILRGASQPAPEAA